MTETATTTPTPSFDQGKLDTICKGIVDLAQRVESDAKQGVVRIGPDVFAEATKWRNELVACLKGQDFSTIPPQVTDMYTLVNTLVNQNHTAANAEIETLRSAYPGNKNLEKFANDHNALLQQENHPIAEVLLASAGQRSRSFSENEKKLQEEHSKYSKLTDKLTAMELELAGTKTKLAEAEKKLSEPPGKRQRTEETGFSPASSMSEKAPDEERSTLVASKQTTPQPIGTKTYSMGPASQFSYRTADELNASPWFAGLVSGLTKKQ
jgi:hypothetical protein